MSNTPRSTLLNLGEGRPSVQVLEGGEGAPLRMLGAPAADKKAVTFDTAHDVSEQRADIVREVVAWLDKSLGNVN